MDKMTVEIGFFIAALAVLFGTAISILFSTLRTGSPPTPSGPALRRAVLNVIAASGPVDGVFYELGSGWGGLARRIAKAHPDSRIVGIEDSMVPWAVSALVNRMVGPKNLTFRKADISNTDISDAALLVCYLSGDTLGRLADGVQDRLSPGCGVVSATFAWPGLNPITVTHATDIFRSPVYFYRIG